MKIELGKTYCKVTREPGDPKYYGIANAKGESALLYAIKKKLNAEGHNFIKTRMHKHGHMMADMQQYLVDYKSGLAIWNSQWALRGAEEDYNKGEVILTVDNLKD